MYKVKYLVYLQDPVLKLFDRVEDVHNFKKDLQDLLGHGLIEFSVWHLETKWALIEQGPLKPLK